MREGGREIHTSVFTSSRLALPRILRTEALIAASLSMGMFLQTIRQGIIAHGELNVIGVEERRDPWQSARAIAHHDELVG